MRPTLTILVVAGHLATIQLLAGCLSWWLSPWPWWSLMVTVGWLVLLVADLRHPRFAGSLPWWQRAIALAVVESPALVFGAWNLLSFIGFAPRFELGAFIVQLWLTPLAQVMAFCPAGALLGRDLWLWALSLAPFLLVAFLLLASRQRRSPKVLASNIVPV